MTFREASGAAWLYSLVLYCILLPGATSSALEIRFDYRFDRTGFFDAPERRALLELAAEHLTERLEDDLREIPGNGWSAAFPHPAGDALVHVEHLSVPPHVLVVFVGARPLVREERLAVGGPGFTTYPCTDVLTYSDCVAEHRIGRDFGLGPRRWAFRYLLRSSRAARQYPPRAFATWGGYLTFAEDAHWYFGRDARVPTDRFDFFTVALHELGHVLGIGVAEIWGYHAPGHDFVGESAMRAHGAPVPLEEDRTHFAQAVRSWAANASQRPVFAQGVAPGERRWLTELDLAALQDVGWTAPAPEGEASETYAGPWIKGDVNGDGLVNRWDADSTRVHLQREALSEEFDLDVMDVAPYPEGDGVYDDRDLELIRLAARWRDQIEADPEFLTITLERAREIVEARLREQLGDLLAKNLYDNEELPFLASLTIPYLPPSTPDELQAVHLLGISLPADPDNPTPGVLHWGPPRGGDANGDGVIGPEDAVDDYKIFSRPPLGRLALEAADVAPMVDGNAVGNGVVDAADLDLFERMQKEDLDGDGVSLAAENDANQIYWRWFIGRPRHLPFSRWTEECLPLSAIVKPPPHPRALPNTNPFGIVPDLLDDLDLGKTGGFDASFVDYLFLLFRSPDDAPPQYRGVWEQPDAIRDYFLIANSYSTTSGLVLEFCSRDGSPWSRAAGVAPEAAAERAAPLRDRIGKTGDPAEPEAQREPATGAEARSRDDAGPKPPAPPAAPDERDEGLAPQPENDGSNRAQDGSGGGRSGALIPFRDAQDENEEVPPPPVALAGKRSRAIAAEAAAGVLPPVFEPTPLVPAATEPERHETAGAPAPLPASSPAPAPRALTSSSAPARALREAPTPASAPIRSAEAATPPSQSISSEPGVLAAIWSRLVELWRAAIGWLSTLAWTEPSVQRAHK